MGTGSIVLLVLALVANHSSSSHSDMNETQTALERHDNDGYMLGHSHNPWGSRQSEGQHDHRRSKRHVVHLYNMISCATGCDPLSYKGYGCYCGFLGSGYMVDGIDHCCKVHDWCYQSANCPVFLEYFIPYYWKCLRGHEPICAIEHGEWGGGGSCAQMLCECDKQLAYCLRRYPCPQSKALCHSSPLRLLQNVFML